jgi:lysozyme
MDHGIDVSHYQGEIDWTELRRGDRQIRFAFVRLAEWRDARFGLDEQATANIAGARRAGIAVGTYVRVDPNANTAEQEAVQWRTYRAGAGAGGPGFLVPAFDIEDTTRDWSTWVRLFIATHRRLSPELDGRVIVYTAGSFVEANYPTGWDRNDKQIALWIGHTKAAPGATPYTFGGRTAVHQYSHTAIKPGIGGVVDLNATMPGWSIADLMAVP